jgi:hypothetical protein
MPRAVEAVEDGDADLVLGGPAVEVSCGELLTEQLQAVRLGPDAAAAAVAFASALESVAGWTLTTSARAFGRTA